MKIPKKVKVGGHNYKVLYPYNFKERTDASAYLNHLRMEIMIDNDDGNENKKAQSRTEEDFWHEIFHCIGEAYCHGSLTEEQIIGLGQGIHQVLSDNFMVQPIRDENIKIDNKGNITRDK